MEKKELKNVVGTCFLGEFALIRRTYVCLAKLRVSNVRVKVPIDH